MVEDSLVFVCWNAILSCKEFLDLLDPPSDADWRFETVLLK
jgi:hypothetical protein